MEWWGRWLSRLFLSCWNHDWILESLRHSPFSWYFLSILPLSSGSLCLCTSFIALFIGFTQYTDLTYPLTTQVILSDGITWELLCYQLNSVALANDWEECETPSNICWRSGPQKMFDIYDAASGDFTGLNEALLKTCLKVFLTLDLKLLYFFWLAHAIANNHLQIISIHGLFKTYHQKFITN